MVDSGCRKYFLGEDFLIGNNGGEEGWFLLMEEGVCDQHSSDLEAEAILLQRLGFV